MSGPQLRQRIAQEAARLMAEEGTQDYARAKRKAARHLGVDDAQCLPANAEIEQALRLHHELYRSAEQPQHLYRLRSAALEVMRLFEPFNPHLVGAVLEGTAGRYAETEIHLFADSLKDVELFLLNRDIPYRMEDKMYRFGGERRRIPVFLLEDAHGTVRLSVFEPDDLRAPPRSPYERSTQPRATIAMVAELVSPGQGNP